MIYNFIDDNGTFRIKNPRQYNLYFPLTDARGRLLSSISPGLCGDIKQDNDHFLTPPASIEDLRSSPLCCREFFLSVNGKVVRLSRPPGASLEAGLLYQTVTKRVGAVRVEILNFIPHDVPAEVMRIRVLNSGSKTVRLTPTSFIPLFGRAEKNLRDHRHVSSLLNRISVEKFGIILHPAMVFDERGHTVNTTDYFVLGYEGATRAPIGQFPTLDYFYGRGDIFTPDAVFKTVAPVTQKAPGFDGKEACAAFRFATRRLAPGQAHEYVLVMGIQKGRAAVGRVFAALDTPHKVDRKLAETRRYWQDRLAGIAFDFGDRTRNGWLRWVSLQPTLRRLFGCSFLPHFDYGKGGRGWRDLWQDALTLLLTEPARARAIIAGSFRGVRLDGSNATIITRDGSFIADRNRINRVWMDHGIWPYLTTRLYVDRTGDTGFLLEGISYFRDHRIDRGRRLDPALSQKDFLQRTASGAVHTGTVLEHLLIQHLVQFFNVGSHNLVRLENADWNDGLDMAPDKGESAAFSFMYCHNLKGLCQLLGGLKARTGTVMLSRELLVLLDRISGPVDYGDCRKKQKLLDRYFERIRSLSGAKTPVAVDELIDDLRAKYTHMSEWLRRKEWLAEGFFNGYYDNKGRRSEGKKRGQVRMMLASQVFAIMSGVADPGQIARAWRSANRYLKDKSYGGFRLNTDFGPLYLDLGRAFGFAYGDKENGAFFSHMNVMFANALYRRGFIPEGLAVMESLYAMAVHPRAEVPPVIPEYFDGQGRGRYLYLTGSASWYIYTLVEEMLGIKFSFGSLRLEPKLVASQFAKRQIQFKCLVDGKKVSIIYRAVSKGPGRRVLAVTRVNCNNRLLACSSFGCLISPRQLNRATNTIQVFLS
ncbi:MAG: cellobiose phosphorylase [Candidatus Omnitrophica bacterium]|nr:cellobiose phosphorylase [Candidatus Omnitrophota bacterium]